MSQDSNEEQLIRTIKMILFKANQLGLYSEELVFELPDRQLILKLEARHGQEKANTGV
jgi:hypothetical protein